jgi:serine protease Do
VAQLGLTLGVLDAGARGKFKLPGNLSGVVVTDVDPSSAAGDKNVHPGDVITEVQSLPVKTPADVAARVEADAKAGKKVELFLINRGGELVYVGLRLD